MILAKPDEPLIEHTENALKVFSSLREGYSEIPSLCGIPQFWDDLFFAVFLHDFGKGASGFQEELKTDKTWNYRHEILSAGFISAIDLPEKDKMAIALAIITHHKDINELREKYATYPEDNPGAQRYKKKRKELDLIELNKMLDCIPDLSLKYLGKKLVNYHHIGDLNDLTDAYTKYVLPYYRRYVAEEWMPLHKKYGIFMKGFLTASDHLASAREQKIKKAVGNIYKYIHFSDFTSVQDKARKHSGDLFIISPTGSGKTEAALLWAHYNQNSVSARRMFYILPYTASINYMYRRFVKLFGNEDLIAVLHGKSSYFIYSFFSESREDASYEEAKDYVEKYRTLARKIFKPYKIMTPFQIIKAFFNLKGFEQNISEMTGGLFIFDEIHSYDPHTAALIMQISSFIKEKLNGKLLFMTATMPGFLEKIFKQVLAIDSKITMKKSELNRFTRHRVRIIEGDIWKYASHIKEDIKKGKKVLVVVNTVKQSQKVYRTFKDTNPNSALLHSRFILSDREKIESDVDNKNLLVGTQVIEVSLNIDYDVLYTEPAPIDALLQRFGRVNRRGIKGIVPVYVFTEGSGITEGKRSIYNKERTEKSINALKNIDILRETIIQRLVDEVYKDGYSKEEQKIFDDVSENFSKFYESNVPFIDINKKESDFYNLFKSVEVIPSSFWSKYTTEIESKRFYEAKKYTLPISLNQYAYLKKNGRISDTKYGIIVDAVYNDELGLLINEPTSSIL